MHEQRAQDNTETRIIPAANQRRAASWFDYGNLITMALMGGASGKTITFSTA